MPGWKLSLVLFALWIVFSGRFDAFHLGMGAVSAVLVAAFSRKTPQPTAAAAPDRPFPASFADVFRFLHYVAWLHWQIAKANLHVIYLALHPRMLELIDPQVVDYRSDLKRGLSHFVLGNSITLTPGTVTIRITDGRYLIHAITPHAAGDMVADLEARAETPAEMERRVAAVFERD